MTLCKQCNEAEGTFLYGTNGATLCERCRRELEQHGQASKVNQALKVPRPHRWQRREDLAFPAYVRGRLGAIVSVDGGDHHLSLSKFPEVRPSDDECQDALRDFGMEGAREDNSTADRADTRHFWLADPSLVN